MRSNELLYVSGSYIPAAGGSEQSMHTLMASLVERGQNVQVLTRQEIGQQKKEDIDGVTVQRIQSEELETVFQETVQGSQPDAVMTQLMWSERVIRLCNNLGLPSVYFVRSPGGNLDISYGGSHEVTEVITNSTVTQRFIIDRWDRQSTIVNPLIDFSKYIVSVKQPGSIGMVNPVIPKGGLILKDIAISMPDRNFVAARGWDFLKDPTGEHWDLTKMQEMADAHNDELHIPDSIDLSGVDNLHIEGPFRDMRDFYSRLSLLLVPSIWDEAFGRVVVESMINGIPVLASDRGNLPTTLGNGGIVIKDPFDINEWKRNIELMDDETTYRKYSQQAVKSAKRFDPEKEVDKVVEVLNRVSSYGKTN